MEIIEGILQGIFLLIATAFALVWYGLGIWGLVIMYRKGYLAYITGAGCVLLLLIGWWGIPILVAVTVGLGGITYFIATKLKPRQHCPGCKKWIDGDVTRCPYCTSEVKPLY